MAKQSQQCIWWNNLETDNPPFSKLQLFLHFNLYMDLTGNRQLFHIDWFPINLAGSSGTT